MTDGYERRLRSSNRGTVITQRGHEGEIPGRPITMGVAMLASWEATSGNDRIEGHEGAPILNLPLIFQVGYCARRPHVDTFLLMLRGVSDLACHNLEPRPPDSP